MSSESIKKNVVETSKSVAKEGLHALASVGLGALAGKIIATVAAAEGIQALGMAIDIGSGGFTLGAGTALGALVGGLYYLRNRTRRQTTVHEGNPNKPVVVETRNVTQIVNVAELFKREPRDDIFHRMT